MIASTSAATMLRSGVARTSCWLQPTLLRTVATTCPYSTLPTPSPSLSIRSKLPTTISFATKPSSLLLLRAGQNRHASTTPSSSSSRDHDLDAAAAARAANRAVSDAAVDPNMPPLDWNTFFQLRKTRRRWQVAFSVVLSLASGTGGAILLSTGAADSLTSQIPLDPVLTLGLMTLSFVALGWLAGPSLGSTVFYLIKRKYKAPMTVVSCYCLFFTIAVCESLRGSNGVSCHLCRRKASFLPASRRTVSTPPTLRLATQVCS